MVCIIMQSGLLYYSDLSFELFMVQVTLMLVKKKLAMSKATWRHFYTHSTCCDEYSHGNGCCLHIYVNRSSSAALAFLEDRKFTTKVSRQAKLSQKLTCESNSL